MRFVGLASLVTLIVALFAWGLHRYAHHYGIQHETLLEQRLQAGIQVQEMHRVIWVETSGPRLRSSVARLASRKRDMSTP